LSTVFTAVLAVDAVPEATSRTAPVRVPATLLCVVSVEGVPPE
jgi:hypothetical protein